MMRVLQVVQKPQRRGAEVFAFHLSNELRLQGYEVRVVYLYPYFGSEGLPLHANDCLLSGDEFHSFEKFPGVHPRLLNALLQQIKEFRPDVIQVNGGRAVKYGAFARFASRNGSWVLIYRNIGNPRDWVRSWYHRFFYKKIVMPQLDGVVGVSKATLQTVREFYDLSIPMVNIPRGVDPTALVPSKACDSVRYETRTARQAPVMLYVGSLTFEKRLDRLLRVFSNLRARLPEPHLWIVGDGPQRLELEQQAKSLIVYDAVRFLGVQPAVANYINAADLFVLTSDTEGIPGVLLEAGFLRLPVVATRVGGVHECVLNGETGQLVDPDNEEKLAEVIFHLLQNPLMRKSMGVKAQEWIRENFLMEGIAARYVDFYSQVLKGRIKSRNGFVRQAIEPVAMPCQETSRAIF